MTETTLIVTMGGQAQVVTFALDWLLAQDEVIREVVVLHLLPKDERTRDAVYQVSAEFSGDRYQGRPCRLRLVPIRGERDKLTDIRDETDAEATWQTVYHLVSQLKTQGRPLHLCIAGGRRMMALLALSAAMLLCGHQDRVWHMYTPADLLEAAQNGAIMHVDPDQGVRLIQVPVVPWGTYFPVLRELVQSPAQAIATRTAWLDEAEQARCQAVLDRLTDRQEEVLRLLATGQTPQDVAEQLTITMITVNSHKRVILSECRIAWNLPDDTWLSYHFIRDKFGRYLAGTL